MKGYEKLQNNSYILQNMRFTIVETRHMTRDCTN